MKDNVQKKYLVPLLHAVISFSFLAIPLLDTPLRPDGSIEYALLTNDLSRYLLILVFFYLNYFYFIPQFYFKKRYMVFALCVAICYSVIAGIPNFLGPIFRHVPPHGMNPLHPASPPFMPAFIGRHIIHSSLSFTIAFLISFLLRMTDAFSRAKAEKATLEFTYLKAQINPHFLFNTLNAIYALAVKKSDKTPEAIQELSGMMRYILHDASMDFILLEKEMEYLDNYIRLQQHRYSYTMDIVYEKTGTIDRQKIAPLVMIPFVENAFKHGVSPEEPSRISIQINVDNHRLYCRVRNSKVAIHPHSMDQSGIGIHNTKARLRYAYPGKHQLNIEEDEKQYSVTLTIDMT